MSGRVLVMALLAAVFCGGAAMAQPSGFADPAELPPAGFAGDQYVDSRGCVFLRAGVGGRVTWVPRVTSDRKQMCDPPVADVVAPAPVAAAPQAAPAPVARVAAPPRKTVRKAAAPAPTPPGMRMACPASTPYLEHLRGPSGDSRLYCTRGDGTTEGAALPRLIRAGKVVAHISGVTVTPPAVGLPVVPEGYVRAWQDDRLNPDRARGTAEGQAAQDRLWTRDVPQEAAPGAGAAVAASGRMLVQVGSFAVPANAERAVGRLASLGLPVARAKARLHGKPVQIVYAGPFARPAEARAALAAARRAGFADAFILR